MNWTSSKWYIVSECPVVLWSPTTYLEITSFARTHNSYMLTPLSPCLTFYSKFSIISNLGEPAVSSGSSWQDFSPLTSSGSLSGLSLFNRRPMAFWGILFGWRNFYLRFFLKLSLQVTPTEQTPLPCIRNWETEWNHIFTGSTTKHVSIFLLNRPCVLGLRKPI